MDRTRPFFLIAVAVIAFGSGCREAAPPVAAPPEVYVTTVVQQDVPEYLDLAGQTEGFQDVDIRARVEGFLESVDFREGFFVRKGELLYRIDPRPFQAALAGAKADLETARARLEKTTNDVNRYTPLAAQRAVSQQELDDARSAQEAARSQVDAARAAVDTATLNLGYTRVYSPIDGLVGTTQVKAGNLVGRGEATLLTTVSQIDPVIFRVAITEADYLRVVKRRGGQTGKEPRADGIELTLADGSAHPFTGRVGVVDRQVNAATGTLGMQIYFPNPQFVLRPGQYGRARMLLDLQKNALLVPQRAVQELQNLYSVAVVGDDNKVAFRNVTVGPRVGELWVIESGLEPGMHVVSEGVQAIADGATVRTKAMPASDDEKPVATSGGHTSDEHK
jgi:membrane fusion protein (multidrug efflux system)